MRLGRCAKDKIRHLVRTSRALRDERLRVFEEMQDLRQRVLSPLFGMRDKAKGSLEQLLRDASFSIWSTREAREKEEQRRREVIDEVVARILEVEGQVKDLNARHDELGRLCVQAGNVEDSVMRLVDSDEQLLRDELRFYDSHGINTPPALPRADMGGA